MGRIINYHVVDPTNIGDQLSAPANYFEFPGHDLEVRDIRSLSADDVTDQHVIVGGGGLLFKRFRNAIALLQTPQQSPHTQGKRILWGVGQQIYKGHQTLVHQSFDYSPYTQGMDLVGIRDHDLGYDWVPCASCMHAEFDKPRTPQHDVVVFSHKKFQIRVKGVPCLTNEEGDFASVLDFLGSGETVLTSSFHGAYWATLLGRKVLAFPFSSKFHTLKHSPTLYPSRQWQAQRWRISLFGKVLYDFVYDKNRYTSSMADWRTYLNQCQTYPTSLEECRDRNRWFYQRVLDTLQD